MNERHKLPRNLDQIVFLDLETTGLSPTNDQILEIGLVIYDLNHDKIIDELSIVLKPVRRAANDHTQYEILTTEEARAGCDPYVQEMHDKSGLWDEIEAAAPNATLFTAGPMIVDWLKMSGLDPDTQQLILAGNGIDRFDRRFLEAYSAALNNLDVLFHYRSLDVSNLWQAFEIGNVSTPERERLETAHRAVDDCKKSIADYRAFLDFVTHN